MKNNSEITNYLSKRKKKLELRSFLSLFFSNVFMFSMNDEVVHTGYDSISHYIFAIACNKKQDI